jgi:hypothetical protein
MKIYTHPMNKRLYTHLPEGSVQRNHRDETWDFKVRDRNTKSFYRKADAIAFARNELYHNRLSSLTIFTSRGKVSDFTISRLCKAIDSDRYELELEIQDLKDVIERQKKLIETQHGFCSDYLDSMNRLLSAHKGTLSKHVT